NTHKSKNVGRLCTRVQVCNTPVVDNSSLIPNSNDVERSSFLHSEGTATCPQFENLDVRLTCSGGYTLSGSGICQLRWNWDDHGPFETWKRLGIFGDEGGWPAYPVNNEEHRTRLDGQRSLCMRDNVPRQFRNFTPDGFFSPPFPVLYTIDLCNRECVSL